MTERQSARVSKIKNDGLDQYGAEPFEQQQVGTAGVKRVNVSPFVTPERKHWTYGTQLSTKNSIHKF